MIYIYYLPCLSFAISIFKPETKRFNLVWEFFQWGKTWGKKFSYTSQGIKMANEKFQTIWAVIS